MTNMDSFSWNLFLWIPLSLVLFEASKIIYRLTLHPLASFPGPKLAAATNFYAAYYDLICKGTLIKQIPDWHDKYGPIVRILPDQLHIRNMEAYNEVFKIGTKYDKDVMFYCNPFFDGYHLNIPGTKEAKRRKDMFQPYFSKAAIGRLEPLLKAALVKFLKTMEAAAKNDKVLDLNLGYRCLTADVIMDYCYQAPFRGLDAPDFRFPFIEAMDEYSEAGQWDKYFVKAFGLLMKIITVLPPNLAKTLFPPIASVQWMRAECRKSILALKARPRNLEAPYPTIFDTMLNPNPEKGQYTPSDHDLVGEAMLMLAAGMDTTANTLVQGTWYVLSNDRIRQKLCAELEENIPDKIAMVDSAKLDTLPYLRAVIKESLRLSYGAPGRLPRVVPATGATLCGQFIPPGTIINQAHYVLHADESVFKDANIFSPERWLGDNYAEMDKNMVSFSRGSRGCLGINLAYAELYLTFAHLFRRLDLSLHETTAADMEWGDFFLPVTRGHLKVTVALKA